MPVTILPVEKKKITCARSPLDAQSTDYVLTNIPYIKSAPISYYHAQKIVMRLLLYFWISSTVTKYILYIVV